MHVNMCVAHMYFWCVCVCARDSEYTASALIVRTAVGRYGRQATPFACIAFKPSPSEKLQSVRTESVPGEWRGSADTALVRHAGAVFRVGSLPCSCAAMKSRGCVRVRHNMCVYIGALLLLRGTLNPQGAHALRHAFAAVRADLRLWVRCRYGLSRARTFESLHGESELPDSAPSYSASLLLLHTRDNTLLHAVINACICSA